MWSPRARPGSARRLRRGAVACHADPVAELVAHHRHERFDPPGPIVEARQQPELAAGRGRGAKRGTALDPDLFERLQAVGNEARADDIHAAALPRERFQHGRRVGLQPLRPPEARLEGRLPRPVGELELRREEAGGLLALPVIGIAPVDGALRQPVEAHHQRLRPAVRAPVVADQVAERADVGGVVVEVPHHTQLRLVAPAGQRRRHAVDHRSRRAPRVLGIERQHEQALAARTLHPVERRRDRRFAVAHRELDHEGRAQTLAEQALEQLRLALGVEEQRRAVRGPDRRVARGRPLRTGGEHEAVEDRVPDRARELDYARVGQELAEIAPDGAGGRRFGRAEVDEQDAGARARARGKRRRRRRCHLSDATARSTAASR